MHNCHKTCATNISRFIQNVCEQRSALSDIDNVNQCKTLPDDECGGGGIACGPKPVFECMPSYYIDEAILYAL